MVSSARRHDLAVTAVIATTPTATVTSMTTPVVTVRGEAELGSAPDLATLAVTIHATGAGADRVRRDLAEASNRLRAILEEHREVLERHATSGLHVGPVFSGRGAARSPVTAGSLSSELVVNDFAALPGLIAALSALDGAQVDGPWWSLRPTNPSTAKSGSRPSRRPGSGPPTMRPPSTRPWARCSRCPISTARSPTSPAHSRRPSRWTRPAEIPNPSSTWSRPSSG